MVNRPSERIHSRSARHGRETLTALNRQEEAIQARKNAENEQKSRFGIGNTFLCDLLRRLNCFFQLQALGIPMDNVPRGILGVGQNNMPIAHCAHCPRLKGMRVANTVWARGVGDESVASSWWRGGHRG